MDLLNLLFPTHGVPSLVDWYTRSEANGVITIAWRWWLPLVVIALALGFVALGLSEWKRDKWLRGGACVLMALLFGLSTPSMYRERVQSSRDGFCPSNSDAWVRYDGITRVEVEVEATRNRWGTLRTARTSS